MVESEPVQTTSDPIQNSLGSQAQKTKSIPAFLAKAISIRKIGRRSFFRTFVTENEAAARQRYDVLSHDAEISESFRKSYVVRTDSPNDDKCRDEMDAGCGRRNCLDCEAG